MTPEQMRELADRLSDPCSPDDDDLETAADYLRACADEKAVGYVTANGLRSLRQDDATVLLYAHDYLIRPDHVALYNHPAPAPHPSAEDASRDAYEGCREDLLDWKRRALKAEREARNLAKALADTVNRPTFMGEPAAPQAEPKRPRVETSLQRHQKFWSVDLVIGVQRFRLSVEPETLEEAEWFAETLRKALGITGDSDVE